MVLLREEYKRRGGGEDEPVTVEQKPMDDLLRVFGRFHAVATGLRRRYDNRPTLDVADEYDVQDLVHALLRLFFDDVRPEEHTPSYAGKSTRMDFLLKNEGVVVDTHVGRLSVRLGLTRQTDPVKIEEELMPLFPREDWAMLAHVLIFHGRRVCFAKSPQCETCTLNEICPSSTV